MHILRHFILHFCFFGGKYSRLTRRLLHGMTHYREQLRSAAVGALILLVSLSQYTFSERDDAVMLNERRALALADGRKFHDTVSHLHGRARLLMAHTIMAQGARDDLKRELMLENRNADQAALFHLLEQQTKGKPHKDEKKRSTLSKELNEAAEDLTKQHERQVKSGVSHDEHVLKLRQRKKSAAARRHELALLRRNIEDNGFNGFAGPSHTHTHRGKGVGVKRGGTRKRMSNVLELNKQIHKPWNPSGLLNHDLDDHSIRIANAQAVAQASPFDISSSSRQLRRSATSAPRRSRRADAVLKLHKVLHKEGFFFDSEDPLGDELVRIR